MNSHTLGCGIFVALGGHYSVIGGLGALRWKYDPMLFSKNI